MITHDAAEVRFQVAVQVSVLFVISGDKREQVMGGWIAVRLPGPPFSRCRRAMVISDVYGVCVLCWSYGGHVVGRANGRESGQRAALDGAEESPRVASVSEATEEDGDGVMEV